MEKVDENYKVPNLEKGIAVLEYLSLRSAGETLQDIKSALDISQTTAYRILNTLVRLEYLNFSEDTKRYKLSRKLLTLGFRSLNEHNLLETVMPSPTGVLGGIQRILISILCTRKRNACQDIII